MQDPLVEPAPWKAVRAGVLAAPLACLVGIFLMTAGTDESWIVLGVRGLAEHGRYGAESPFRSIHSTGGAYTIASALFHLLGRGHLEAVRLVAVLALAGLLSLTRPLAERVLGAKGRAPWLMSAALLAVPGTFMFGSQAYGEVLATMLVVAGALLWGTAPGGTWSRRVWTGLLVGTAAATRLNCIVALAALPLAAFLNRERRRAELLDAAAAAIVGALAFGIQWQILWRISVDPETAARARSTYGLDASGGFNLGYLIPLRLTYWSIAQDFLPFFVIVAVVAGWCWARTRVKAPQAGDLLLAFSVLLWGAWMVQAPIPHLRYLWPGLVGFALIGGLVLAVFESGPSEFPGPGARSGTAWVALALLASGYVDALRTYQNGESDILSWQWHRGTPSSIEFGPVRALRSQKAIVRRLEEIPAGEDVATFGFDTALSLLTRRPIVPVAAYYPSGDEPDFRSRGGAGARPRWLVITPFINRFPNGRIPPALHRWIEENCRLDCKFGPYVLYEVRGRYPESVETFALHLWAPRLPLVTDAKTSP